MTTFRTAFCCCFGCFVFVRNFSNWFGSVDWNSSAKCCYNCFERKQRGWKKIVEAYVDSPRIVEPSEIKSNYLAMGFWLKPWATRTNECFCCFWIFSSFFFAAGQCIDLVRWRSFAVTGWLTKFPCRDEFHRLKCSLHCETKFNKVAR